MRYLITGGAGFIGSHLTETLISRNDSVVILDNLSTGSIKNTFLFHGKVDLEVGSILDRNIVNKLVEKSDFVVHLAAALGVVNIVNKHDDIQ